MFEIIIYSLISLFTAINYRANGIHALNRRMDYISFFAFLPFSIVTSYFVVSGLKIHWAFIFVLPALGILIRHALVNSIYRHCNIVGGVELKDRLKKYSPEDYSYIVNMLIAHTKINNDIWVNRDYFLSLCEEVECKKKGA